MPVRRWRVAHNKDSGVSLYTIPFVRIVYARLGFRSIFLYYPLVFMASRCHCVAAVRVFSCCCSRSIRSGCLRRCVHVCVCVCLLLPLVLYDVHIERKVLRHGNGHDRGEHSYNTGERTYVLQQKCSTFLLPSSSTPGVVAAGMVVAALCAVAVSAVCASYALDAIIRIDVCRSRIHEEYTHWSVRQEPRYERVENGPIVVVFLKLFAQRAYVLNRSVCGGHLSLFLPQHSSSFFPLF